VAYTGAPGVQIDGIRELVNKLQSLEKELRTDANTELRQGAKDIALDVVKHRHDLLGGGGTPQEWGIVDATRVKYDRYVAVRVPGIKPRSRSKPGKVMTGLRRTPAARAKSLAIAVEWGSTDPRLGRPPKGALVGRNITRITDHVIDDYEQLLNRVLHRFGLV
jgi:hypothetical protein